MDVISHLEDQWPMDTGFVMDYGVFVCYDDFGWIGDKIKGIGWKIG